MIEPCMDSASSVMQEAAGRSPSSPENAPHKLQLHDAASTAGHLPANWQQKRPPASPQPQQSAQAVLVTQNGSRSSSVGAFGTAQWLLSVADAWRPSAAEFEAHCHVVGKLGKGLLTDVYHVKLKGGHMVLKVMRPKRSAAPIDDGTLPELLLFREARALKQCKHSNIVRCRGLVRVPAGVRSLGDPNTHWAMLQDLLPGKSLAHIILHQMGAPSFPTYSTTDALNWALDIAQAVAHMHSQQPMVVHGDLRLENVLLTKGQEGGARKTAKLTDLAQHTLIAPAKLNGASTADNHQQEAGDSNSSNVDSGHATSSPGNTSSSSNTSSSIRSSGAAVRGSSPRVSSMAADRMFEALTAPGRRGKGACCLDVVQVAGGVARAVLPGGGSGQTGVYMYMAPEVFRCEPYNEKADIFSLGVILYQLLARNLLLFSELRHAKAADDKQFAAKVATGYRASRLPDAPDQLWGIIEACWSHEPCDRPDSEWVVQQLRMAVLEEGRAAAAGGGFKPVAQSTPASIRGAYKSKQSGDAVGSSKQGSDTANGGKQSSDAAGSGSKQSGSGASAAGKGSNAAAGGGCCVIS